MRRNKSPSNAEKRTKKAFSEIPNSPLTDANPADNAGFVSENSKRHRNGTPMPMLWTSNLPDDKLQKFIIMNTYSYRPATASISGKIAYISYYVADATGILRLKREKHNRIKDKAERDRFIKARCREINLRLACGWNPFTEVSAKPMLTLADGIKYFEENHLPEREDSIRTYRSIIKIFSEYAQKRKLMDMDIRDFNAFHANDFLQSARKRGVGPRTQNNYLIIIRTFFNRMEYVGYIDENPFARLSKMRETPKRRSPIPVETLAVIYRWFEENDSNMCLVCDLLFYMFLRPAEQSRLRMHNVLVDRGVIVIEGTQSKDHNTTSITIPDHMLEELEKLVENQAAEKYLFSKNEDLTPGHQPINSRDLARRWADMRKALKLPMKYTLYSMKDSGAEYGAMYYAPRTLQKQIRHGNLGMTERYLVKEIYKADPAVKSIPKAF